MPRFRALLAATASAAAVIAAAVPAAQAKPAAPAAASYPVAQMFAPWNDASFYFLAPGGGFDAGIGSWTVSGATAAVADDNPLLGGTSGRAIELKPGASVTSPAFAVGKDTPHGRAFARVVAGAPRLQVEMLFVDAAGVVQTSKSAATLAPAGAWAPTSAFSWPTGQSAKYGRAMVRFTASGGTARLDDVYVDPRLSR